MSRFATRKHLLKMKTVQFIVIFFLSINLAYTSRIGSVHDDNDGQPPNNPTNELYKVGVDSGIINPEKYSLEAFKRDENIVFKDLYAEYISLYENPVEYEEWLILNNFGLLPDTQESVLESKSEVERAGNKNKFINAVKTGDILITSGPGIGGFIGHAAIMTTDNWVVEMPGGKGWDSATGIKNNNRRISKSAWYDIHKSDWTTVYRSPNNAVAKDAASWATRNYFNPSGGSSKTVKITYRITSNFSKVDPSYCSKLVIQAYHNGTGSKKVINEKKLKTPIAPNAIPNYFLSPYKLKTVGRY